MRRLATRVPARIARSIMAASSVAALSLTFTPVAAQAPPPPRPDYRVTRFDENWAALRKTGTPEKLDALKFAPLNESGSFYLSLGGQLRGRSESVRNFGLASAADRDDSFELVRLLLNADVHLGPHLRLFAEGKHAMAFSRELPGGKRPLDQDEWEMQNAFGELTAGGVTARVGRQELLMGSQRLVSPLDWTNTRRTFEGARVMAHVGGLFVDGFLTRPVMVANTDFNKRDPATTFGGVSVRPFAPAARFAWELYGLVLSQDATTKLWAYAGEHDRVTLGARTTGEVGAPTLRFEVEGGYQMGTLADLDIAAWFVASDLIQSFPAARIKPTLGFGFDWASGDGDPADGTVGTFHQLYPLGHAYVGYMDLLGRQNMVEARVVATAAPTPALSTRASLHRFRRASSADAVYGVAGAVFTRSPGTERAIGTELDLTAAYKVNRHTKIDVGYGHFAPGAFMTGSTAGAVASDWGFVASTFTF